MAAKKVVFHGTGFVWDKDNDCALCEFVDGVYETNVKREIDILRTIESVQESK